MKKQELKKLAQDFVKTGDLKNKQGCYITLDGSVFYRNYAGLQYARAQAGNTTEVFEFDENGELVNHQSEDSERVELLRRISDDQGNKYEKPQLENLTNESLRKLASDLSAEFPEEQSAPGDDDDDDGEVNLDKMNRDELISLLFDLDPTSEIRKETKNEIKDLIVISNTLAEMSDEKLISLINCFSPDMIAEDMTTDDITKILNTNELKAVVLNLRDEVELDQEISDKLFAIGEEIV